MKAIISDIHGNYEALKQVLRYLLHSINISSNDIICLGDVVGYGAEAEECISLLQNLNIKTVKGNHEEALTNDSELDRFNPFAKEALELTKQKLSHDKIKWAMELPYYLLDKDILYVHGTPINPQLFKYLDMINDIENFSYMKRKDITIAFVGHTHVPAIYECEIKNSNNKKLLGKISYPDKVPYKLKSNHIYMINVGSVGQPRNGINKAHFCLFDEKTYTVSIESIAYDIHKTAKKIIDNGLHSFLAERLIAGR